MPKHTHFLIVMFALCLTGQTFSQKKTATENPSELAQTFVSYLANKNYKDAVSCFDSTMNSLMPTKQTREIWEDLLQKLGSFQKQLSVRTEKYLQYDIVFVTCQFDSAQIDVKVVCNPQRQIAGLFFVPVKLGQEYNTPDYGAKDAFYETEVSLGDEEWLLPGIISIPHGAGPFPAVVLVHGSGPNDKDETIGPNKPFRDLAWGLASTGIAVLRYDKRTKAHGAKMISSNLTLTVKEETVDDALYAVAELKNNPHIDPDHIFVLGHSLGGMLIPRIGLSDSSVAGFIIMAGATRPLEDLIIEQYEYIFSLDGQLSQEETSKLGDIKHEVKKIKTLKKGDKNSGKERLMGASSSYWLDLKGYDPAQEAAALHHPILVLQGERDYQVTIVDFEKWKEALSSRKNVTFKLYPQLNHLFIKGEGKSSPGEYQNPGHVAHQVIEDITRWIKIHVLVPAE